MSRARNRAWLGFGITAAGLVLVVSWLTAVLVQLDRDELHARRQAALHERLRLALWRMDSWLAPQLAREALRPPAEFRAFPSAAAAWTRGFSKLGPGEVVVQSPLLGAESALFALHFELRGDALSSPQVPLANERDVAEANGVPAAVLERAAARLRDLAPRLTRSALDPRIAGAEALLPTLGCNPVVPETPLQTQQSVAEYSSRQRSSLNAQGAAPGPALAVADAVPTAGPLVPAWIDGGPAPLLVFARRVRAGSESWLQGVVVDWTQLQRELLALVVDLFPSDATELVRCESPDTAEQPSMLASVPARLQARLGDSLVSALPLPLLLAVTWGVTLLGLLVLGFTLRAAIGYGERRARFASAVTHELRTPLTTFRMYSEMLAEGIVRDPQAQHEYLTTLQRESDRLARLVENVLQWSRLEEGRFASRREAHGVDALLARIAPPLRRRLAEAGLELDVQVAAGAEAATVTTDDDAVGQILFNLADNAAKYARGSAPARVELAVQRGDRSIEFAMRDHGPGVPPAHRQRIFLPFDRGSVPAASNDVPGTGLGLPLARALARDLGGDLRLDPGVRDGARFVLELPA